MGDTVIEQTIHDIVEWFIFPLCIGAGFADYLFHRRTQIENHSGIGESLIHHVMLAEVGLPLVIAVFLRIDAAVILLLIVCFIAHEITGNVDIRYAEGHGRLVSATEDQVHSILEVIPLMAALLIVVPHFGQAVALLGLGAEHTDFSLSLKDPPPISEVSIIASMLLLFVVAPYAEETVRCLRAQRRSRVGFKPAR